MDLITARKIVDRYITADQPVMLWGPPGLGKSDLVRQIAAARKLPLIDVRAVLLDPVDLRGLPVVTNGKAQWVPPVFLPDAKRDGKEGILFLDELNAAPPSVQAACFQLVLDRRVGEYELPPGWRIIAAGNRQSDRASAQKMPTALANRFASVNVDPDVNAWQDWARDNIANPVVPAFIRFRPALLFKMPDNPAEPRFPTPRAWANVARVIDGAPDDLRLDLTAGLVGDAVAAEFEGFCRVFASLPKIGDILADPENAKVPVASETAAMYAVATALARSVDQKTFPAAMTYMKRLPTASTEFLTVMVMDAAKRDAALKNTKAYVQWAAENAAVIL